MPILNIPKKDMMRQYLDNIPSGTEITASDFSRLFNLSNASRAGKELGMRKDINKIDKGVYVKV